jgi:hypothetical protein
MMIAAVSALPSWCALLSVDPASQDEKQEVAKAAR